MMKRKYIPSVVLFLAFSLLGATLSYGQSARVKIELKVIKVKAYDEAVRKGLGGNEVRFDVWLESEDGYRSSEVLNELNGVKRRDLPHEISASGGTTMYVDYGKSVEVWLEGWEEDNCGKNDEYDDKFACKDDRRCMQGFAISYEGQQPGTWHPMNNLKCANKHEVWVEYRWSFSVSPEPIPLNENNILCRNEPTAQFQAKNNFPHSEYVHQYEWEVMEKYSKPVYYSDSECELMCTVSDPSVPDGVEVDGSCKETCKGTIKKYEDAYRKDLTINLIDQNSNELSFATNNEIVYARV